MHLYLDDNQANKEYGFRDGFVSNPLSIAARSGKLRTLQKLIKYNPNLLLTTDAFKETLLHHAATGNASKVVLYLDNMQIDLNTHNAIGQTPFMTSCRSGGFESAALLINRCSDINERDHMGCTALHLAARSGNTELVTMLIFSEAELDALDSGNCHPLHYAAFTGNPNMCSLLLRFSPKAIMLQDFKGNTPLHVASSCGRVANGIALLKAALQTTRTCFTITAARELTTVNSPNPVCNVALTNDLGQTPEHVAGRRGHFELAAFIQNELFKSGKSRHGTNSPQKVTKLLYFLCGHPGRRRAMYFWMFAISFIWLYPYLLLRIAGSPSDFSTRGRRFFIATNVFTWICYFKEAFVDPGFLPTNTPEYEDEMRYLFIECRKLKFRYADTPKLWDETVCASEAVDGSKTSSVTPATMLPIRARAQLRSLKLLRRRLANLCHTCGCVKPIRSKHCGLCNRCVRSMDHHCPVTDNCVGENNRVWFLMTSIMVTFASTWIGLITIDYWLKAESTSLWEIVTLCLLSVGWLMAINAVFMTVGNALFNLTTNELVNWRRYEYFGNSKTGFCNPFNRGYWGNVVEFFRPHYYQNERELSKLRSCIEDKMTLIV